jgi:hypothetical protein
MYSAQIKAKEKSLEIKADYVVDDIFRSCSSDIPVSCG